MGTLGEAFLEQRNDLTIDHAYRVIKGAIIPFEPGRIVLYLAEKDFHRDGSRILQIEVENVPSFHFRMNIDRMMSIVSPDQALSEIYVNIFNHYRYRPTLPVEDHIQLGED